MDKILQCDHLNESSVNGLKYDRPSECSPEKDCLGDTDWRFDKLSGSHCQDSDEAVHRRENAIVVYD